MGVALADVQGDDLAVLGIAVDEGDVVEQTKAFFIFRFFVYLCDARGGRGDEGDDGLAIETVLVEEGQDNAGRLAIPDGAVQNHGVKLHRFLQTHFALTSFLLFSNVALP